MSDLVIATLTIAENASISYSLVWDGITSVTNPVVAIYRGSADVTSSVMPSGSHSVSNNVLTLKYLEPMGFGGDTLTANIKVTADGQDDVRFIRWLVAKETTGRVRVK